MANGHFILPLGFLISVITFASIDAQRNVHDCCRLGKEAVVRRNDITCDASIARIIGVRNDAQCRALWTVCCLGNKRKLRCEEGSRKARENKVCDSLRQNSKGTEEEYCCSCCRAGFAYGIAGKDCNVQAYDAGCNDEARSCCVDIKRDSRLRDLITGGRPSPSKTCKDRPCSHICIATRSGYRCMCRNGYELQSDAATCSDIDECKIDSTRCGAHGTCVNLFGGFYCNCERGYKHDARTGKCEDVDECQDSRPCSHQCKNTQGSFGCVCPQGYILGADKRTCARIDLGTACSKSPCKYKCQALGSTRYQCICPAGYRLASDYISCKDINECAIGTAVCGTGTSCFNTYGSYKCVPTVCHKPYLKKVGQRYCIKSTCEVGDAACSSDVTYSYQWFASAQLSGLEPRTVEYYYSLSRPSFPSTVRYEIAKGNEDETFYLEQSGGYKVFLRNRKRLAGPKDYKIVLHINIYTDNRLYTRLVNVFYIYVSAYEFR